jgi:hypothetical protein
MTLLMLFIWRRLRLGVKTRTEGLPTLTTQEKSTSEPLTDTSTAGLTRPITQDDMREDFRHAMDTGKFTLTVNNRQYHFERKESYAHFVFDSNSQVVGMQGWIIELEPSLDERTWLERMLSKSTGENV